MIMTPPPSTPKPRRTWLLFALFPLVGIVAAVALILSSQPAAVQLSPTPAPVLPPPIVPTESLIQGSGRIDFTLALLSAPDTTVTLSELAGETVILNFWATWCIPCERELPALQQFARENPAVRVYAVNIGENAEAVQPWLDERGISDVPVLLDIDLNVRDRYGIFSIPVTFALDRDGVVQEQKFGEITLDELRLYAESVQ
jgi:thiol-disulfide isomerase/thioredoxin